MGAQYHNGHWYGGGQDIDIQSDPTATSFESGKVPTGDTVQSVLNSNFGWKSKSVNLTNSALNTTNSLTVSEIANAKEVIIQAKNQNCQEHFFRVENVRIDRITNFTGMDSTWYVQWAITCNFSNNSISLVTYTKGGNQSYPIIDKVYYR